MQSMACSLSVEARRSTAYTLLVQTMFPIQPFPYFALD